MFVSRPRRPLGGVKIRPRFFKIKPGPPGGHVPVTPWAPCAPRGAGRAAAGARARPVLRLTAWPAALHADVPLRPAQPPRLRGPGSQWVWSDNSSYGTSTVMPYLQCHARFNTSFAPILFARPSSLVISCRRFNTVFNDRHLIKFEVYQSSESQHNRSHVTIRHMNGVTGHG